MPESRIPAVLVTGARGAGKTHLIARLLSQRPHAERWAVLVNDFGATTLTLPDPLVTAREVSGCICCTAHVALRVALVALMREARPHRILIEASAAATPAALLHVLAEPGIAQSIELRKTLCVVAPRQIGDPRYSETSVYREQIAAADVIVISATSGESTSCRAEIERIRDRPGSYYELAAVDLAVL